MPEPTDNDNRVVPLRPGAAGRLVRRPEPASDADSLKKFEQGDHADDYRERMITNIIAGGFLIFLIVAGVWIANTMAAMRKNQDCVFSGRRGCTPVEAPAAPRW